MRPLLAILSLVASCICSAADLTPGVSIFGRSSFIEYIPGDLPLIISAPHGGRLKPADMPDRTNGVVDIDANTQELARTIASVIHEQTGRHIHLVICSLHRSKLDANRDLPEAAQNSPLAEHAWTEHHDFIDQACAAAVKQFGVAFLIDLHGHGHAEARIELGYLHNALELADCDEALNESTYANAGSLRWIAERSPLSYTALLRGPQSFGALLELEGFPATPSPRIPVPTEPFFRGGYTIQRHCSAERQVAGLQIEANRPRLRDTAENRLQFSHALVKVLRTYFPIHLGIRLDPPKPVLEAQ
ncbi:hypothetical protein [Prosthecobacter sp.]|uniref:hypothetical protein n=1 Tax=Prosthecobacter sp. TaxID=1965333 RepID=UPI003783A86C